MTFLKVDIMNSIFYKIINTLIYHKQ